MKWTLIYIDDQIQNIELYKELLEPDFDVIGCNNPRKLNELMQFHPPHAFLFDIHMPETDGFSLYQQLEQNPNYNGCPVFFISGDVSVENKIKSYKSGAVDFIPRDIRADEILVRLSNKIKLYQQTATQLQSGNVRINVEALTVTLNHQMVDLTLSEFRILLMLVRSFPKALTREEVIQKIWGGDSVKPGTVNTHITNLKMKIADWNKTIKIKGELIQILDMDV